MAIMATLSGLMTLEQYRSLHRMTYRRLADLIGLRGVGAVRTVQRYAAGLRFPPPPVLRRIREATGAAVTAEDFVDQHTGFLTQHDKERSDGQLPLSKLEPSGRRGNAADGRRWPYQAGRRGRLGADD